MLRRRSLTAAALAALLVLTSSPRPSAATDPTIGNSCTSTGGYSARKDNGNNTWCNGTAYQYPFYIMGSAAAAAQSSCSGYTAGAERWNTTLGNLEVCDGTTWQLVGVGTSTCGSVSGLSFTNVTNATLNTIYTSNAATITFSGCSGALSVSVTGAATAQISVNGGTWSTAGAIASGQTLQVRLTSSGSASTGLTATVTVGSSSTNWTVTTRSGSLKAFLTGGSYLGGNLGGLSGADAICQTEANGNGYAGTYIAIMSDESTNAKDRLTLSYPIVNAYDNSTVTNSNLWVGAYVFIKNASGISLYNNENIWTGTHADGTKYTGATCNSWTTEIGYTGRTSQGNAGGGSWIDGNYSACNVDQAFYCIQQ